MEHCVAAGQRARGGVSKQVVRRLQQDGRAVLRAQSGHSDENARVGSSMPGLCFLSFRFEAQATGRLDGGQACTKPNSSSRASPSTPLRAAGGAAAAVCGTAGEATDGGRCGGCALTATCSHSRRASSMDSPHTQTAAAVQDPQRGHSATGHLPQSKSLLLLPLPLPLLLLLLRTPRPLRSPASLTSAPSSSSRALTACV